jgi:SAM-dependent methyltransferase
VGKRYTTADLSVLTRDEARRFVPRGDGDPRVDLTLAWELLYRLEPELYDRLVSAERLHPDVLRWLPDEVERIVEVGAGAGRLTVELIHRAREVVAVEPAAPLRQLLDRKLSRVDRRNRVRVTNGFFDDVPVADDFADLVVACSAHPRQSPWRRSRLGGDGAGLQARWQRGHRLAKPRRLARCPWLSVRELRRRDVCRVRQLRGGG